MEQEQTISTEVGPQTQSRYAGFGRRFLAYFVDFLITFAIGLVLQSMLGQNPLAVLTAESLEEVQQAQAAFSGSPVALISLGVALAYFLIFWVNYDGATPGKRLMAVKITKDDGSKLTYPTAFIRYIGLLVSAFALGLGYLWIIWDKRKQGWHDKIAKTVVVKTGEKPKTVLAIFLSLVGIILFGMFFYKGFSIGWEQAARDTYEGRSLKEYKEAMGPVAKIHWDRAQELFKEMRANINDTEKIRPLADEVIQELKQAVEANPDNPVIWSELGNAYTWPSTIGKEEDALNAFKKAEELDPNNVIYINFVGDELIRLGRYEEAILHFQKTLRLTEESGYANLSVGIAYKKLGIYDSAREHLQKAIDIFTAENKEGKYDDEILQARKEIAELPR